MAKRFTETGIWDDQWYQDLPVVYKLAWRYICDKCDIAGVWKVNKRLLDFQVGEVIPLTECIKLFNHEKERIIVVNSYWILADFIRFQYGTLNDKVPFHRKIKESLDRLDPTLCSRLQSRLLSSLKAKDKDKDSIQGGAGGKSDGYTLEQCLEAADKLNIPAREAESFHLHYSPVDWIDGSRRKITNLSGMLQKWHVNQAERGNGKGVRRKGDPDYVEYR